MSLLKKQGIIRYGVIKRIFWAPPPPPCHTLSFRLQNCAPVPFTSDKLWHETEENFLHILLLMHIIFISKRVEKVNSYSFHLCTHSLLHINTYFLTCHLVNL